MGKLSRLKYRLTTTSRHFSEGLISVDQQEVPLWAVRDLDLKQSLQQKMLRVGTVIVRVQQSDYTGRDRVELQNIESPIKVRDLVKQHAQRAPEEYEQRQRTRYMR
jgi:uncharacterized membrane protein YdbT with pleckstrin-like domain